MVEVQVSKVQAWQKLAQQLRIDSIRCTTEAGSGHPTSSMSAADLMAVLMEKYLRYDFDSPHNPNNDRLIFSKGHAAPLLYSFYKAAGAITDEELMSLRKNGSRLEGHPVPEILPWVDVATGSLGQGLSMGTGMALVGKYLDKLPFRTWVLLGDSETAEGSVWEAFNTASFYKLDNLTAIIDMNRLGQRGPTELQWDSAEYAARARAFGWHAIEINGHDVEQIDKAFAEAQTVSGKPCVIIAKTEKGHGIALTANKDNWHGKALSKEQAEAAIKELGGENNLTVKVQKPASTNFKNEKAKGSLAAPAYTGPVATREAYGDALKALGSIRPDVVVLDAEVGNSTYSEKFRDAFPDRFFEMYIAEQQMVGAAIGMSTRGKTTFSSTFAAFLTRAYDFIRMGAVSRAKISLCGSHAGVSIGQDGPSQMALEDLAMMRAVYGSTVLYPSDAVCAYRLVEDMADLPGISYMRSTREKTPILYKADEKFPVGGSKVLRSSDKDKATLIAAGITLHESLKAYEELKAAGINVRVIDLYSIKPVDVKTLQQAAKETGLLITVEDHYPEGGIGEAVAEAFSDEKATLPRLVKLAVRIMAGSATPDELLDSAGINAKHIVNAVKKHLA
ncbi:MAG: transketolase [Candidatus Obscuribacterales bacterium]|nr:transketolase [Candidatus Obscuribacterales bacterium]